MNQYLAVAALIAARLHGIENELELDDVFVGNANESAAERVPAPLREATASAPAEEFENAVQDCCACSRIPDERSFYDRFLANDDSSIITGSTFLVDRASARPMWRSRG